MSKAHAKLRDCLSKTPLPERAKRAILAEARSLRSRQVITEAEAARQAVEKYAALTREDLEKVRGAVNIPGDEARAAAYGSSDERPRENPSAGDGTEPADAEGKRLRERAGLQGGGTGLVGGRGGERGVQPGTGRRDRRGAGEALASQPLDERGRDPRLVEAFGEDWPGGWNALGLPNPARPLRDDHPLLTPTETKAEAILTSESRLVTLGLLPAGRHERAVVQDVILDYFLKGGREAKPLDPAWLPQKPASPEVMFMGGGGGAGKSSLLKKLTERGEFNPDGRVLINADEIRELLPEYDLLNAVGDARSSTVTHEESSRLSKDLYRKARQQGFNITFDGTLANEGKALAMMRQLRVEGYRVRLLGVTIDPLEAMTRAYLLGKGSKRFVPDDVLLSAHRGFNAALPAYLRELGSEVNLFDNSPEFPIALSPEEVLSGRFEAIGKRAQLDPGAADIDTLLASFGQTRADRGRPLEPGTILATSPRDDKTMDLFATQYVATMPAEAKVSKAAFKRRAKKELPAASEALFGELFEQAQKGQPADAQAPTPADAPPPTVETPDPAPVEAPVAAPQPSVTPEPARIEDFGETIRGARKEMWGKFGRALEEGLPADVSEITMAKHFPEPNYEKLLADGVPARDLAAMKALRDMIPPKPRQGWKLKRWGDLVTGMHATMRTLTSKENAISPEKLDEILGQSKQVAERVSLYRDLGYPLFLSAKEWAIKRGNFSVFNGERYERERTITYAEHKGRMQMDLRSERQAENLTEALNPRNAAYLEVLELVKAKLAAESAAPPTQKAVKFGLYQDRFTKEIFIGKDAANGIVRLKTGFPTAKDARAYLTDNRAALEAQWEAMKAPPALRRAANFPRQGVSRREGDVSPEMFHAAFGFRGVQFGNYVESDRRQADLNEAFDALVDMAEVLRVPAKALSLDGSLGLAFGARGHGNAKAHYEPGEVVINITKTSGPGSLAHEWFHALDNYFARLDRTGETAPKSLDAFGTREIAPAQNMRPEVWSAFKQIRDVLGKGEFAKRSNELDAMRIKPYYGTTIEKAARAFESYVEERLEKSEISNDYLVNIDKQGSGAYPTTEELDAGIRGAYDNLFNTLDTRETARGTMLFAQPLSPSENDIAPNPSEPQTPDPAANEHAATLVTKALADLSRGRGGILQDAYADVGRNAGAIAEKQGVTREEGERLALIQWAVRNGRVIPPQRFAGREPDDGGVEHYVFFREFGERVGKLTLDKPVFPLEYLRRMALSNAVFTGGEELEGITFHPGSRRMAIVISQPFRVGEPPTEAEIDAWMAARGFPKASAVTHGAYVGHGLNVTDASPKNWIKNAETGTLTPIDIRVDAQNPEALAAQPIQSQPLAAQPWQDGANPSELFQRNLANADAIARAFANIPGIEAADVQQQARIALARAAREFAPERGAFGPYAGTAIRNALRTSFRDRLRDRNLPILDEPVTGETDEAPGSARVPDTAADVAREVAQADARRMIDEVLAEMPAKMARALRMRLFDGATFDEVGAEVGAVKQGAQRLYEAALDRARRKLGERGVRGVDDLLVAAQSVEKEDPHEFSSTQVNLPEAVAGKMRAWTRANIPDAILADDGREDEPHVTALFGLHADDAGAVREAVRGFGPVKLKLGKVSMFSNEKYDVLKVSVTSPDLHRLNKKLRALPHTNDFPDYTPHATLAYVKKGEGKKFVGRSDFEGVEATFDSLLFSGKDRTKTAVPLVEKLSASPLSELMAMLDGDALDDLTQQAGAELPGFYETGRPDLSYGTRNAETRAVDEWRKETTPEQTHAQWEAEARRMLAADYDGFLARVVETAMTPGGMFNAAETKAIRMVIAEESAKPMTTEQRRRVQALVWADRETGAEQARGFGARRDLEATPEQRHRLFLTKLLYTPPAAVRKAIEQAATAAEKQKLLDADAERLRKIEAELGKMGVSLEDIFSGEVALRLKSAKIVGNILSGFDDKRRQAFDLMRQGNQSFAAIAKATGLTDAEAKAVHGEFRRQLEAKMRALGAKKKGFNVANDMERLEQGTLLASPVLASSTVPEEEVSEEEFQRRVDEAMAMMGVPKLENVGKMKVVKRKRKKLFAEQSSPESRPPGVPPSGKMPPGPLPSRFDTQEDLLNREKNKGRAPFPTQPPGTPATAQGDLLNPERNADRQPTGLIPQGAPADNQGEFTPGYGGGVTGPGPSGPVGNTQGRQTKLELPFEEWMFRAELADPAAVARIARMAQAATGHSLDMAYEYWINGILSGPQTHIANVAGNSLNAAWDLSVQRGMEALVNLAYRDEKAAQLGEFRHILAGLMPGLSRGLRLATKAWSAEADFFKSEVLDQQIELFEDFEKGGGVRPAIPGKAGRVIRMPGRALLFMDSFFKGAIGQMEAGAQAYRIAKAEGLKGDALSARMRQLVNTPGSEAWRRAVEKATELTFQTELKTREEGGGIVENAVARFTQARTGSRLLSFLFPFIRTPFNIFRTGLRKTPLGSLNVLTKVARGLVGIRNGKPFAESYLPAEQVRDLAEQAIAWVTLAALWGATQGDEDDDEKKLLITGSQPFREETAGIRALNQRAYGGEYMVRIGGRGGITFSYGRYEPLATVMGTIVDAVRQLKQDKPNAERLDGLFGYFVAQAQAKTFLRGFSDLMQTASSAQSAGDFARKTFATALVPNLIRQPLRNLDDYVRDSKRAPLSYELLPASGLAAPKADVFGRDVQKGGTSLSRLLFPAGIEPDARLQPADELLLAYARLKPAEAWAPSPPRDTFVRNKETVQMTPEQYRRYSIATGRMAAARLSGRITRRQIANPTDADVKIIRDAFEEARDQAKRQIFGVR